MSSGTSNKTLNTTDEIALLPASHCIPWIVLLLTECLVIVLLNAITIIVFLKQRRLWRRRRRLYLIIHLTLVDLLVGAISGPLQIEQIGPYCGVWRYNVKFTWGFHIKFAFLHLFSFTSLTNLVAISLERVHATFCPFGHSFVTTRFYRVAIPVIWFATLFRESVQIFSPNEIKMFNSHSRWQNFTLYILYYCVSIFVICCSYCSIFLRNRFIPFRNSASSGRLIKERRLTSALFTVTVASLLSLLPAIIFLGVEVFCYKSMENLSLSSYFHIRMAVLMLFLANSLANPIIYSMRMRGFLAGVADLLWKASKPP